jgi:hypothetical protein
MEPTVNFKAFEVLKLVASWFEQFGGNFNFPCVFNNVPAVQSWNVKLRVVPRISYSKLGRATV